jgi:hypothetical protein
MEFRVARYDDVVHIYQRGSWSAQADGWNSMWILRSISTKGLFKRDYQ